ncbi:serine hydrolase domain-containing protein [Paracoccus sp. (in: a-proteobacteria)]|uniref:serine hydrolase domain-containing protein n=1 Tax=Paracoccus sp. TaxID=267 RepID=UPI003A84E9EC
MDDFASEDFASDTAPDPDDGVVADAAAAARFEARLASDAADTERNRGPALTRGRVARRVHGVPVVGDVIGHPGPVFDRSRMVDEIVARMEGAGAVGYTWAIVQNGQLADAGGMGSARTTAETDPRDMRPRTRMVSASLAKPVCAVTVMKLVEDGIIAQSDAAYPLIADRFPDAHPSLGAITVRDLLTHRSGFDGPGRLSAFPDTLQAPLAGTPGVTDRYENWNYWFLAHIVECVTGKPYVKVARQSVLLPMGCRTMTRHRDAVAPCLYYAAGADRDGRGWDDFTATAIGAYGWYANAIHWAKFMAHFRHDTVLSRRSRHRMLEWDGPRFGFRLWHGQPRGSYYGHGGDFGTGGRWFHGGMMGFPDGIDAVLLTNSDDVANPEKVLMAAYHAAYG